MQNTSALWKTLLADPNTTREVRAVINGVTYGETDIYKMRVTGSLYDEPSIGNATAREIELVIRPKGETIPRMARIVPSVRLVNGNQQSEWLQKGEFFIDTRSVDSVSGILTIHGFDAMLKADRFMYYAFAVMKGRTGKYSYDCPTVVQYIAEYTGISVDPRTNLSTELTVEGAFDVAAGPDGTSYPFGGFSYTMRETLGFIAAMHGGNWTITDNGKLWLCPFVPEGYVVYEVIGDYDRAAISVGGVLLSTLTISSTSGVSGDAVNITSSEKKLDTDDALTPWGGVAFLKNGELIAYSGNGIIWPQTESDSGRVMAAECPCATDAAANLALGNIRNASYKPYTASGAIIDPAAELGDMVTQNGSDSVAARLDWTMDSLFSADVAAPGDKDINHEFPYDTPVARNVRAAIEDSEDKLLDAMGNTARTVMVDFSHMNEGYFTELIEGDENEYVFGYSYDSIRRKATISYADGVLMEVKL